MPLQIYMTESGVTLEEIADNVNAQLLKDGRCMVVVSEGLSVGDIGEKKDSFGHTQFGSSQLTVQQAVVNYLNSKGIKAAGSARGQVPGTDQRHNMIYASVTDLDEAYSVGREAVEIALHDGNGWMATILRNDGPIYNVRYDKVPLDKVALSERAFRYDVTDDFVSYARPLIGDDWVSIPVINGIQRFARLKLVFAGKKLPGYTLQGK
jgi:6-phosphofructokinase 1